MLRQQLGCWLHERWKAEFVLRMPRLARQIGWSWMDLCNRDESLSISTDGETRICDWSDSSQLTLAKVFPSVANRLFKYCQSQHPILLVDRNRLENTQHPDASILIAIGGRTRLPLLHLTLMSLIGQTGVSIEIIVCEIGPRAELEHQLPTGIRYLHVPMDNANGFNKSIALNRAAELATGEVLLVHDGDYVVPADFVRTTLTQIGSADGIRPCRFIFHLDRVTTQRVLEQHRLPEVVGIEKIVQNNPTPMAVKRDAYQRIGGHDEDYFGWGGEDTEFISRLRTSSMIEGGTTFALHLWHPAAPKKASGDRNRSMHDQKMRIPESQRIHRLRRKIHGCHVASSTTGS
ncbi:hypothetical protein CGZ80_00490 [Rhodopirellula sp. MGV]|nr:hypothetical protein CGZ80_00490 [Rhodopirellula sp. MGV]PNY35463.1 hypothetical protein C2E31_18350 [Rhodopirellula baltica]